MDRPFLANIGVARDAPAIRGEDRFASHASSGMGRRGFRAARGSTAFFDPLDQRRHAWTGVATGAFDSMTHAKIIGHISAAEKSDGRDVA